MIRKPVCLVTGASGYLGKEVCAALASSYHVVAQYRSRVPELTSQLRRPLGDASPPPPSDQVYCVQAELTDAADRRRLVEVALARFEVVDHLIHLAADTRFYGRLMEISHSNGYEAAQFYLNSIAPLALTSSVFDLCWKDDREENLRRGRSVVTVSSGSSVYVLPDTRQAVYGASKAALNLLTLYAAAELAPYNVRANVICPGSLQERAKLQETLDAICGLLTSQETGELVQLC